MDNNNIKENTFIEDTIAAVATPPGVGAISIVRVSGIKAINVVDSVGAGDAYAGMLAAGILNNWPPQDIVERASLFASRICEIKGAIPASAFFYEPFRPLFGGSSENAIP